MFHSVPYPVVLISSYSHEACLRERERAEVLVCIQVAVRRWIHIHHMEAWLIAMHGVQYHLEVGGHEKTQIA